MVRRNRKKCVAIARDVLLQLRLKRYWATPGTYVYTQSDTVDKAFDKSFDNAHGSAAYRSLLDSSFQKLFKNDKKLTCDVCAMGAAFVSLVNIENKCSIRQIQDIDAMFERLEQHFGSVNMSLMESAFERTPTFHDNYISETILEVAAAWGGRYKDNGQRLRAIMLNVIRNNGDFKLPKKDIARAKRLEKEEAIANNW